VAKILTEEPRAVTELRRSVPAHVAATVSRSLERLPADRFATADDFVAALDDAAFTHVTVGAASARVGAGGAVGVAGAVAAAGSAGHGRGIRTARLLAGTTVAALVLALWGWLRPAPSGGPLIYDVALPADRPIYLKETRSFSVSPTGDFLVYRARADTSTEYWYRSLVNDETRRIVEAPGAVGAPIISPDGARVAYGSESELRTMPIAGGPSTTIGEMATLRGGAWLPEGELVFIDGDGELRRRLDPGGGELSATQIWPCISGTLLPDTDRLLFGGGATKYGHVIDASDLEFNQLLLTTESELTDPSRALVRGSDFRVIDQEYVVFISSEGDLRAASFDLESLTTGRSITLLPDVWTTSYAGQGQYDITPDGTLVYVPGPYANVGQLVKADADGVIRELPLPTAAYLPFDVSPDGRRLAAAVEGVTGQELRIYDLETGREQTWFTSMHIGHPRWSPTGDGILVSVASLADTPVHSMVFGSPDASSPPDTVARVRADVGVFLADSLVILDVSQGGGVRLDLRTCPATIDTISEGAMFAPDLSPDGRWLTYSGVDQISVELQPFPSRDLVYTVGGDVFGNDAQWLSANQFALYDYTSMVWYRVRVDATRDPPFSEPEFWFRDEFFSDTPGASHVATPDGGVIYMRASAPSTASFFRVSPGWVDQMKAAVDEAGR